MLTLGKKRRWRDSCFELKEKDDNVKILHENSNDNDVENSEDFIKACRTARWRWVGGDNIVKGTNLSLFNHAKRSKIQPDFWFITLLSAYLGIYRRDS